LATVLVKKYWGAFEDDLDPAIFAFRVEETFPDSGTRVITSPDESEIGSQAVASIPGGRESPGAAAAPLMSNRTPAKTADATAAWIVFVMCMVFLSKE